MPARTNIATTASTSIRMLWRRRAVARTAHVAQGRANWSSSCCSSCGTSTTNDNMITTTSSGRTANTSLLLEVVQQQHRRNHSFLRRTGTVASGPGALSLSVVSVVTQQRPGTAAGTAAVLSAFQSPSSDCGFSSWGAMESEDAAPTTISTTTNTATPQDVTCLELQQQEDRAHHDKDSAPPAAASSYTTQQDVSTNEGDDTSRRRTTQQVERNLAHTSTTRHPRTHPGANHHARQQQPWNESCSLYVTNLAPEVRWQDLKDWMRRWEGGARVKSANVYREDESSNDNDNSSNCYGVVVWGHPDDAARARRELDGRILAGRPVQLWTAHEYATAQSSREPQSSTATQRSLDFLSFDYRNSLGGNPQPPSSSPQPYSQWQKASLASNRHDLAARTVYLNNLPPHVTWQAIKDWFREQIGNRITSVNIEEEGRGVAVLRHAKDAEYVMSRWKDGVPLEGSNNVVLLSQAAAAATSTIT